MRIPATVGLAAVLAVLPALAGCVDLAIAGAIQAGVEAMRARGLSGTAQDSNLYVAINQRWLAAGASLANACAPPGVVV
jgi:hypothetical protein